MKIGLDLRMAGSDFGIGRYSLELARHILDLDRQNQYYLFVRDADVAKKIGMTYSNAQIVVADFRHYSFEEQIKFPRVLNKYKLDLVHFMNFNVPLRYSRPFVVTIHDVIHHRMPGNKPSHFFHRLAYKWIISSAAKRAEKVITVSNFSKREIAEVLKISPEKIEVAYEAADPLPVSDSDVISVRQRFNITKPYIIFVGVMERKKNLPALSRAFNILKEQFSLNIQLVLVGKEDIHHPEVVNDILSIKYAKDLVLTGSVTDKDKFALYKGAQAFVSPSMFEGFGLPGLEAMKMGLPLVVSNTEVFNEVYDNGAIYFNPKDPNDIAQKINFLLTDEKYKNLIANHGFVRAQNFTWEKTAKQTIKIYESCA